MKIQELVSENAHEIARKLGIEYYGDIDPINHNGTFFETNNWDKHGYANCLSFYLIGRSVFVDLGSVNMPDDIEICYRCFGIELGNGFERTAATDIEVVHVYYGQEVDEDFSGRRRKTFRLDNNGNFDEEVIWKQVATWLHSLRKQ